MPFDLVCQILPFRITDTRHLKYELKPESDEATDPAQMIRRGRELQAQLESGDKTVFKHPTTPFVIAWAVIRELGSRVARLVLPVAGK